mgnify:FL=1|tara:strand:+ start:606 stop:2318 length:1713 start_codon:yes stop_codon:yes gene_type:complete
MSNPYKIIPADKKYKGAPPVDTLLNVNLEEDSRELIEGDRSVPLNLSVRYNTERQNFSNYRLYGKIQPYVDNAFSGTASQTASNLIYSLYSTGQFFSGGNVEFKGYPEYRHFDFLRSDTDESVAEETNWNLYVTIPTYDCDGEQPMSYTPFEGGDTLNFLANEGIPFYIKNRVVGGKKILEFTCGAPHGLKMGEYVRLNIPNNQYPGFTNGNITYPVFSLGNSKRQSNKHVFNLYIPSVNNGQSPQINDNTLGLFKRQINLNDNSSVSSYYVIEHEIITDVEDYTLNKCAFAEGVFKTVKKFQSQFENPDAIERVAIKEDYPTYLYSFTKDINVKKYLDNLQRPITTLYITIMLRNNLGYLDYPPTYGWDWNFPYNFADTNFNGNIVRGHPGDPQPISNIIYTTIGSLNSGLPLVPGDKLRGAFTEYNKYDLKERTISDIKHSFKFNTNVFYNLDGEGSYTYKPHYPVPIRTYSDYIESGDPRKIANVPDYATYFEIEKTWKWRDIYDIGFIEGNTGVDYPFINASHYPMTDISFFVNRLIRANAFINEDTYQLSAATNTNENFIEDGCE